MRDASGNLVEVRLQEPWALHLLTADGTNSAVEDAETMKAPAEPALVRLTTTGVKILVERYVRFDGHFPHSPQSPPLDPGDGEMGNEGKGGKDIPVNEVVSSNFKRGKPGWSGRL